MGIKNDLFHNVPVKKYNDLINLRYVHYVYFEQFSNKVDIYIDGSCYIHFGLYNDPKNKISILDNGMLSHNEIAFRSSIILQNKLEQIANIFTIDNIYFFIDGRRPNMKSFETIRRSRHTTKHFDKKAALITMSNILSNTYDNIYIIKLKKGESEIEMFLKRDISVPQFFLTEDSDLFLLSHNCLLGSFMLRKNEMIIDLSSIAPVIPKPIFSCILLMCGSDYTLHILTESVFKLLMNLSFDDFDKKYTIIKEYTEEIVKDLMNYIFNKIITIILNNKLKINIGTWKKKDNIDINLLFNQYIIPSMVWTLNYFTIYGNDYQDFDKIIYRPYNINSIPLSQVLCYYKKFENINNIKEFKKKCNSYQICHRSLAKIPKKRFATKRIVY